MRYPLPLVACALALGCGGAAGEANFGGAPLAPTVRVENGVTILEHPPDAFERATRVTVDPEPLATMGGAAADPAYDLTFADNVLLLEDGRVLALARVGNRIMLFDTDGRGTWLYNREGRGPGDLMAPGGLASGSGDTVFIPDASNQRINRLIPGTGIVSQSPLQQDRWRSAYWMAGVLPSGMAVMHRAGVFGGGIPRPDTATRTTTPIMLVSLTDGSVREIASVTDLDHAPLETRFRGRRMVEPRPLRLTRSAQIAVWDSLIATGTGDGYQIDLRNGDGQVVQQLRVPIPRRPVTQAIRDAQIAIELERFEGMQTERMVDPEESRRLIYERPFADTLPPYSGFFVTPAQTLWVVDYVAPGDTSWSATAFDRSGAIVGRLTVPGPTRPVAFGDDRVVVRGEDDDGVVFLRVLQLRAVSSG